jgi:hypothetical protein
MKLGLVAHSCNPSTWEMEAGEFCVPGLHGMTQSQKAKQHHPPKYMKAFHQYFTTLNFTEFKKYL